jgi:surface protein
MIQRQIVLLLAIISVFVLAASGSQAAATGNLRASVAPPSGNKDKNSHERNERLRRLVECDSRCSQPNATGIPIPDYYNIAAAVVYYTTWPDQNPYGTVPNCWDTSQVTDMSYGFFDQDFNERIDCWDTSNVVTMQGMFQDVPSFNQPLNTWNVSKVTDMSRYVLHIRQCLWHFAAASDCGRNSNSHPTTLFSKFSMFHYASNFNQPLDKWDVSSVQNTSSMFSGTSFNQPLNTWNVSKVTDMSG